MFCPKCGNKLPDEALFCDQCGTALSAGKKAETTTPAVSVAEPIEAKNQKLPVGIIAAILLIAVAAAAVMLVFFKPADETVTPSVSEPPAQTNANFNKTSDEPQENEPSEPPADNPSQAVNDDNNDNDVDTPVSEQSEYILPYSDSRYIDETELAELNAEQCRLARNEIYARHGRKFNSTDLQDYFNAQSWYTPTVEASAFSEAVFNEYEKANRDLILAYEKKKGYQ